MQKGLRLQDWLFISPGPHHWLPGAMQDIAVLNQMFSTAVLHQAEAIESIYSDAVHASQVGQ